MRNPISQSPNGWTTRRLTSPARFYRRELPALLSVISKLTVRPEVIIIDGYVWLGDWDHPGLGAHLHKDLGGSAAVIGVAKKLFRRGPAVRCVRRGTSARPLYVSTAGMDLNEAAARIVELHGEFRVPTLLKRVDRLCRGYQDALESEFVKRSPKPTRSEALTAKASKLSTLPEGLTAELDC